MPPSDSVALEEFQVVISFAIFILGANDAPRKDKMMNRDAI